MQTSQDAAVAAVERAAVEGIRDAAVTVFDALDKHMGYLSRIDRYDFAIGAWNTLVDTPDIAYTNEDLVLLVAKVAGHIPEGAVVNIVDARFGDQPREIELDNGTGLTWDPDRRQVDLMWPVLGQVVVHTFGGHR